MGTTARPSDDVQRASCIASLAFLAGGQEPEALNTEAKGKNEPKVPPLVRATVSEMFVPVRDRYLAALAGYRVAKSSEEAAGRAAALVDKEFDRAFRHWSKSVKNDEGHALPREIAKLLRGVRPGKLVKLPFREEVNLTAYLFEQLAPLPHLQGERARLTALVAAHAALTETVNASEAAERARRAAKRKLDAVTREFDKKWMATVDMFLNNCPEVAQDILPAFPTRNRKAKADAADWPEETSEPEEIEDEEIEDEEIDSEELDSEEDAEDDEEEDSEIILPPPACPPVS